MLTNRIENLMRRTGWGEVPVLYNTGHLHNILDQIDKRVGLITRHGLHNVYGLPHERPIVQEYVGARVTRLERHLDAQLIRA